MNGLLLTTKELTKTYPAGMHTRPVVDRVDLEVRSGEFLAIMGSSGSGKSTLLYLLSGLDQASKGRIQYGDFGLKDKSEKELALFRRKNVGFVFQSFNLVPYLSLLDNVTVPGWLRDRDKKSVVKDAERLLNEVGIADLKDRLPSQVSGGEQQRCAIARAMINRPRIVFADEPTGNLNSAASQQVLDFLSHFHQGGQAIVMVTHDPVSAGRADRILFLQDGAISDVLDFDLFGKKISTEEKGIMTIKWLTEKEW